MKQHLHLILAMTAAIAFSASAADTNKAATATTVTSWIDHIAVAPLGAVRTSDLNGRSEWGAGLDLGVGVNPFVSIHVVNLAFEGPGQTVHSDGFGKDKKKGGKPKGGDGSFTTGPNSWGGTAVDETDILCKAIISPWSTEKFSIYGVGGGLHTWGENQRWGLSAGAGVELHFNKTFSLGGDYSVRFYSESDQRGSSLDGLVRVLANFSF